MPTLTGPTLTVEAARSNSLLSHQIAVDASFPVPQILHWRWRGYTGGIMGRCRNGRGTGAIIIQRFFFLAVVGFLVSVSRYVVCHRDGRETAHAVTPALASGLHRIVKESLAPHRRKTHVTTVDVGELLGRVEGARGPSQYQGFVWAVFDAWRPRYVRVRCADAAGVGVGVRVYRVEASVAKDSGDSDDLVGLNGSKESNHANDSSNTSPAWCGWSYAVRYHAPVRPSSVSKDGGGGGPWCWVSLPVGVAGVGTYRIEAEERSRSPGGGLTFTVEYVHELSVPRLAVYVLGAVVFAYAVPLANSLAFRLTAGTCGCIVMSAILVLYVVWRHVPYKKSMVGVVAVTGTSAAVLWKLVSAVHSGVFRGDAGIVSVILHPLVLAYVVASGLVGMGVTYYWHDPGNEKMNTIVQVGLQLVGVGLMVGSATTWAGGFVWCGVVVARILWSADRVRRGPNKPRRALHVDVPPSGDEFDFANSPRMEEEMDVGPQSGPPSTPTVFRVSTTRGVPPSPTDFPEAAQGRLHGLVRRGKILNVETDRTIAIGKGKYNELFLKGYEVNFESGEITPPRTSTRRSPHGFR